MTDVATNEPETQEEEGWAAASPAFPVYPEHPNNPHNHRFTLSYDPTKPPFMVVRADTAADLQAALDELETSGVNAAIGAAWSAYKAAVALGAGMGQTTPVNGAPAPAQVPQQGFQPQQGQFPPGTGPAFNPQMPPPGVPGQAPASWQNAGAPQGQFQAPQQRWGGQQQGQRQEYPAPQGWLRLNGARKEQVDAIAAQYGVPKGNPSKGGKYNFFGLPQKSWYCAPEAAQVFAQFSPVPA